ncbi:ATP-binding cassette domain-containing protein [Rhizobium leguminosarum bv. viciae]|nr:ATP-binding cassette domain-containing protein [Rhizobium leguminosarum bv. viciae]
MQNGQQQIFDQDRMATPPEANLAPLSADGISAGYGRQVVVDGISLAVPEGKMTVLVGPNGSGKSTLLSVMARLLKPLAGTICLDGKELHRMPTREVARRLGLLPQSPLLPEGLTVYDLVSRGRYPHQGFLRQWTDADEAAVEQALDVTDTLDFAARPVDSLSGGQRQRCWIAMALAQQTPVILLDEPTTFLDLHYQVEVLDLLRHLTRNHGRTIVAVLHDLNFALQYADRVVFLKDGAIRFVAENPRDCTADLIRNVFNVEVVHLSHPETGMPLFLPSARTAGR